MKIAALISLTLILFTELSQASPETCSVAADGSGDFKTVQEAIAFVSKNPTDRQIIHLKPGTYEGPVTVPYGTSHSAISFMGDDPTTTVIDWNRNMQDPIPDGADRTNPGVHVLNNNFHAENVTFRNSSGDHGQGLAIKVDADRVVFYHCRFLGWQDTVMLNKGRQYFRDCYIEGRVDFIYGDGTAVFDHCELHSKNGGYLTAASTPQNHLFGFVFLHCKLTGDDLPWVDPSGATQQRVWKLPNTHLGRPWRPHASVAFIECEMGEHIAPAGWNNWGKAENEATARYAEYHSSGPGAHAEQRVAWAKQWSKAEAEKVTVQSVLGGLDNWEPEKELVK